MAFAAGGISLKLSLLDPAPTLKEYITKKVIDLFLLGGLLRHSFSASSTKSKIMNIFKLQCNSACQSENPIT